MERKAFVANVGRQWLTSASARAAYTYVPKSSDIPNIGAGYAPQSEPDPVVHIKLFDPAGGWTWYLIEANPETGEAYGLVDGFEDELGYIDLNEIAAAKQGQRGLKALPIERDIHWTPKRLSEVQAEIDRRRG